MKKMKTKIILTIILTALSTNTYAGFYEDQKIEMDKRVYERDRDIQNEARRQFGRNYRNSNDNNGY